MTVISGGRCRWPPELWRWCLSDAKSESGSDDDRLLGILRRFERLRTGLDVHDRGAQLSFRRNRRHLLPWLLLIVRPSL